VRKDEDKPLGNGCNSSAESISIKQYFMKYPNSTAKECCKILRIDYQKLGGRARKIKHDLLMWKRSIVPVTIQNGQAPRPLTSHRLEYRFLEPVPEAQVAILNEKVLGDRVEGIWYRSPNRNRQLEYFDKEISMRIYPKSGTCRIIPRRVISFEELRVKIEDVFAKVMPAKVLLSESFRKMVDSLQVKHRHRTFHTGPMPPFKNRFYRDSLGIDILSDGSHPEYLEVHEYWPSWIPTLLEFQRSQGLAIERNTKAVSDFASQIESHLDVMKGIGTAADRLNMAVRDLARIIHGEV